MIKIVQGQEVRGEPTLRVATASGDYEDTALMECYSASNPEVIVGAYQAQFVKYGALVYQHSGPTELGKALLLIDPKATHNAASYVRITNELLAKMSSGALELDSLDQVVATEQAAVEEQRSAPEEPVQSSSASTSSQATTTAATTPEVPVSTDVASTTPSVLGASTEATSTPPVFGSVGEAATSTSELVMPEMPATTTPEIPPVTPIEATSSPEVLRGGGKKIARAARRSRG